MKPMTTEPRFLRVFCDYTATGLWDLKTGCSVDFVDINVPHWLEMMFDEWQADFDTQVLSFEDGEEEISLDLEAHDRKGLALAHKLLHYLPEGSEVWFFYESDTSTQFGTYESIKTGEQLITREQIRALHEKFASNCSRTDHQLG